MQPQWVATRRLAADVGRRPAPRDGEGPWHSERRLLRRSAWSRSSWYAACSFVVSSYFGSEALSPPQAERKRAERRKRAEEKKAREREEMMVEAQKRQKVKASRSPSTVL